MMRRVLVANRGEIALRIVRACHEEGLEAIAVFSEVDRGSPHVRAADAAVCLGPPPAGESYLNISKLLSAADQTGADAVHPGYGFLAERPEFAEAVMAAGLTFVGPRPESIRAMGEKTAARRTMRHAGVPVVPGTTEPVPDVEAAVHASDTIGYPVMVKAVAGGGGKGMRVARSAAELRSSFGSAASEALKAFGNGELYIERLIERPRHVEVQILADTFDNIVTLGERECSVQRRHQKMIEEAPSPAVDADLRERMSSAAASAAAAVQYLGAGTIEFLLEPDGGFYFLEMNTRIQVEHPVTEMVYGVDLVRQQLRIARGERLPFTRHDLQSRGHAIECRITSEDPFNDFLPATGRIVGLALPSGPGVRWDGGIDEGNEVGLFYDALLGKLIAWGETRDVAIARMRRALQELVIIGIHTSQPFHVRVMTDAVFVRGDYDIGFLESRGDALLSAPPSDDVTAAAAVAAALAETDWRRSTIRVPAVPADASGSAWLHVARRDGLR